MKRNIKDIYNLINEKIENAENDLIRENSRVYPDYKKRLKLQGEIEAYRDIKILIETSRILNE